MPVDKFGRMSDTKLRIQEYRLHILIIIILEVMVVIL